MWITLISATGTAYWLWLKKREEPALGALAAFCLSMALWCFGHIAALNNQTELAVGLLLANPILSTSFLHFVLLWLRGTLPLPDHFYRFTPLLYSMAIAVTGLSIWAGGGLLSQWNIFPHFFHLDNVGWLNVVYTVVVGIIAHILLLFGFRINKGNKRRSIIAMFATGGWGFLLATSFILPSLGSDYYPYPMLAMPTYTILLVYSVVRYRMVEVNRWVSQAIQWLAVLIVSMLCMTLVLSLLAPAGLEELAEVPTLQLFSYSSLLLFIAWLLYGPAKQFSDRLIYPGAVIDENTLNQWLQKLNGVTSWQELASTIEKLWNENDKTQAGVKIISSNGDIIINSDCPVLFLCIKRGDWQCHLNGWQDQPPSQQHMAELLSALIPNACASLERSLQLAKIEAQSERERIEQQHLVELGGLTAAIAHELRNPLNIINMASAQTDTVIKTHIQNQVARAELLIRDTLSYAGSIELKPSELDLVPIIKQVIAQIDSLFSVSIELESDDTLFGYFDGDRIQQILINLLENSAAFIKSNALGRILIVANMQKNKELTLTVHNNGPVIPADMLPHLFEPFITQRSGGSGLGLSIVRRIVDAYQGSIEHRTDQGWPVSFIVKLPIKTSSKAITQQEIS
jgi:nitrogen-specific signal transduction histidine kinase